VQPLVETLGDPDGEGVNVDALSNEPERQECLLREDVVFLVRFLRAEAALPVAQVPVHARLARLPVVPGNLDLL
jgi:hypothetical protein